ncbi:outer membrane lipoprotein SlyB [Gammaproteobacteria bacterium]
MRMVNKIVFVLLTLIFAQLLSGCSTPVLSESMYRSSEVGVSKKVLRCRVVEAREVMIRGSESDAKTGGFAGTVAGGVLGATMGSMVGKGMGKSIATEVGAIGGGVAGQALGSQAADKLSERKGIEYSYILENGEEATHVQELLPQDRILRANETCRVQISPDGKNRVLPAEQLPDSVYAPKKTEIIPRR